MVMGKHSGRNALKTKLKALGYDLKPEELDDVFKRFKQVAEVKSGGIADEDLVALVSDQVYQPTTVWELVDLQVVCGTTSMPTATVRLRGPDGIERVMSAIGTGPVDAAYKAVDRIVMAETKLVEYSVNAVTAGIDALATTRVAIQPAADLIDAATTQNATGKARGGAGGGRKGWGWWRGSGPNAVE